MNDPEEKLSKDEKKSRLKDLEKSIALMGLVGTQKSKTATKIIEKIEQQKQLDGEIKQKFEQISERMNQTEQKVKSLRKKYTRL